MFIEHCGRFLLRSPDSHLRAKALLVRPSLLALCDLCFLYHSVLFDVSSFSSVVVAVVWVKIDVYYFSSVFAVVSVKIGVYLFFFLPLLL